MYRKDLFWIYAFSLVGLVATGFIYADNATPEWQSYQQEFRARVARKFGAARAAQVPVGLQQVWVKDLNRVDRCTTCHQAIEWKGMENEPNPFRSHPPGILDKHPIQQYGCTICHGGQGYATDFESAHGPVEHWEEPVLGKDLAGQYLVHDREAMMQRNCNICHRYDKQTPGADVINRAKQIVQQKGCRACHTINGRGGTVGPDLTYEGSKSPEQHDYSRMYGPKAEFAWHVAHFQNPRMVSADSVMPMFGFNSSDAQALALLVMSWRRTDLPVQYIPGAKPVDRPTAEEKAKEQRMLTGPGSFFVKKGCFTCHSISTFGVESATNIGPDLAQAATDVESRFGKRLEDFLANPTGTMSVVLATQIKLTDAEKKEAAARLRVANHLWQQKKKAQHGQPQSVAAGASGLARSVNAREVQRPRINPVSSVRKPGVRE